MTGTLDVPSAFGTEALVSGRSPFDRYR